MGDFVASLNLLFTCNTRSLREKHSHLSPASSWSPPKVENKDISVTSKTLDASLTDGGFKVMARSIVTDLCVCVCVCVRERERESGERESVCVCVCVCV